MQAMWCYMVQCLQQTFNKENPLDILILKF